MGADARGKAEFGAQALIRERETRRAHRILEQGEEAVRAVDLAPVVLGKQVAGATVMRLPQLGRTRVAQLADEQGAVDEIGEQERAGRHGRVDPACGRRPDAS